MTEKHQTDRKFYGPPIVGDLITQEAPSALPPLETQGRCERSRLAACSLPVSIVAASALSLRVLARSAVDARDARNAIRLAGVLSGEADAACANKRQPEENVKDEPRPI